MSSGTMVSRALTLLSEVQELLVQGCVAQCQSTMCHRFHQNSPTTVLSPLPPLCHAYTYRQMTCQQLAERCCALLDVVVPQIGVHAFL